MLTWPFLAGYASPVRPTSLGGGEEAEFHAAGRAQAARLHGAAHLHVLVRKAAAVGYEQVAALLHVGIEARQQAAGGGVEHGHNHERILAQVGAAGVYQVAGHVVAVERVVERAQHLVVVEPIGEPAFGCEGFIAEQNGDFIRFLQIE